MKKVSLEDVVIESKTEVINGIKAGKIDHIELDKEETIDSIMGYALDKEIIQDISKKFPDLRLLLEVPVDILVTSGIISRLKDNHSLISSPYALKSAKVVSKLGYNIKILEKGFNDRVKGKRDKPFSGDVMRKLLGKLEKKLGRDVSVSALVNWFNNDVAKVLLKAIGKDISYWILDTHRIIVPLKNENYEGSGVVKEGEEYYRGYKVGVIRAVVGKEGIIVGIVVGPINVHDIKLCEEFVLKFPYFNPGDTLIEDRGFIDGDIITTLRKKRKIHVHVPLKVSMDAHKEAVAFANMTNKWEPHPIRPDQQIHLVEDVAHIWKECQVKLNGCVVRWKKEGKEEYEYRTFCTTNPHLGAKNILGTYDLRSSIEEDFRQLELFIGISEFKSTKLIQVVYNIIMTLLTYNLYVMYRVNISNDKVRRSLKMARYLEDRDNLKNPNMLIYQGGYFTVMRFTQLVSIMLDLEDSVRQSLKQSIQKIPSL